MGLTTASIATRSRLAVRLLCNTVHARLCENGWGDDWWALARARATREILFGYSRDSHSGLEGPFKLLILLINVETDIWSSAAQPLPPGLSC
jgi:hypothetical protein